MAIGIVCGINNRGNYQDAHRRRGAKEKADKLPAGNSLLHCPTVRSNEKRPEPLLEPAFESWQLLKVLLFRVDLDILPVYFNRKFFAV